MLKSFSGFGPRRPSLPFRPSSFRRLRALSRPANPVPAAPSRASILRVVQPRPSRFVPVEAQHSLQSQSAGSGLLGGDPPHRTKPHRQRAARVLKDGPRGHRGLAPTRSALQQHFSQRPRLSTTATRTAETVRPAQPEQILPAGLLTAKTGLELCQVPRIIFHLQAYYILGLPESTGYPSFDFMLVPSL